MSNAREERRDLETLQRALPDFQGYQYPEHVKGSDQIFRRHAIVRLQRYRCGLAILRAALNKTLYRTEQSKLEDLSGKMEAVVKFLGKGELCVKSCGAPPGGTTDLLAEIYRLDLKLLQQLGVLDQMLKGLEESLKAREDISEKIHQLSALLEDFQHCLEARYVLVQKINGNYWALDLWL